MNSISVGLRLVPDLEPFCRRSGTLGIPEILHRDAHFMFVVFWRIRDRLGSLLAEQDSSVKEEQIPFLSLVRESVGLLFEDINITFCL